MLEEEPDAGLGNGGLGRLAACFLDSMATMQLPAMGYGLRYEYGIFRRPSRTAGSASIRTIGCGTPTPGRLPGRRRRLNSSSTARSRCTRERSARSSAGRRAVLGVPHDRPIVGYGGRTINTLRLWAAATPDVFDLQAFSTGEFVSALAQRLAAELDHAGALSRRFDDPGAGSALRAGVFPGRLLAGGSRAALPPAQCRLEGVADKAAIQLNDTHPSLAVPELMRILLDEAGLGWDQAWDLTRRTLAYTNHTLLPEALEKWPLRWFELMLPRHLEIISGHQPAPPGRGADALPGRRGPRQAGKPYRGRR